MSLSAQKQYSQHCLTTNRVNSKQELSHLTKCKRKMCQFTSQNSAPFTRAKKTFTLRSRALLLASRNKRYELFQETERLSLKIIRNRSVVAVRREQEQCGLERNALSCKGICHTRQEQEQLDHTEIGHAVN